MTLTKHLALSSQGQRESKLLALERITKEASSQEPSIPVKESKRSLEKRVKGKG